MSVKRIEKVSWGVGSDVSWKMKNRKVNGVQCLLRWTPRFGLGALQCERQRGGARAKVHSVVYKYKAMGAIQDCRLSEKSASESSVYV